VWPTSEWPQPSLRAACTQVLPLLWRVLHNTGAYNVTEHFSAGSAQSDLRSRTSPVVSNWLLAALALLCLLAMGNARAASGSLTLSGTPPTFVHVGQPYEFRPTASGGAAGATLQFFITNHPSWTTFNRATGELTGNCNRTGTFYNIVIGVTDGVTRVTLPAFSIRVGYSAPGSPPTISGSPPTSVTPGSAYSFTPTTTDPSGKPLTFSISGKPGWASFSSSTGQLAGTPQAANAGTYSSIVISVSDGSNSASLPAFSITVNAASSSPPTISGSPPTGVTAGSVYSFTPTTTDPSGKPLTFSISGRPSWASFNAGTGQLSGTPSPGNVGNYPSIVISVSDGTNSASLPGFPITVNPANTTAGGPVVLYSDILAGPNSGGEDNAGAYLSIFGVNFGSNLSAVSVTVGGGAVARVIYLGPSNGRPDIQQLAVQLGANASSGSIVVTVGGVASNSDQTFTVSSGNLYYVDNVTGSDSNDGSFTAPLQTLSAATGKVKAGDFMVLMSNPSTPYTTTDPYIWPVKVGGTSTTAAITLMGYPGQFPYFNGQSCSKAGIYVYDGSVNSYINVVGMKIDAAGTEGAVDVENSNIVGWRVVNNELLMTTATSSTLAGGIAGEGTAQFWVGNHIHDTAGGSADETHGIYVNNGPGSYEIAYNWIENVKNGTGIQIDGAAGASGSTITAAVHLHHNIIHDIQKYGIELGDYSNQSGFMTDEAVWDNLVYNTRLSGLIFNTITSLAPLTAVIYNNTFYNVATSGSYGAIDNDNGSSLSGMAITFTNNIVIPHSGSPYFTELSSSLGLAGIAGSNNLFSGGSGSTLGSSPITSAPAFASPPAATVASGQALPDMTLASGSAGIGAGSSTVLSGNGIGAMTYLPAFAGVGSDLNAAPMQSSSIDVGAVQ